MMIEDIKFSVLVPAFKSRFLAECIESVLAQTYTHLELIIVNDASPENLDEIVARYDDRRIRYYVNETNFGAVNVVGNWNKCLSYATGEYVICMGDDDKLLPCCLEEYRKLMEKYPGLGVYHGWTEMIDENNNFVRYQYTRPEWESVYEMIYNRWEYRKDQFIGDFCFDTEGLRKQGGFFDLPLAWGSDDISAYRAAKGKGIANTQKPCFLYRVNSFNITSVGNVGIKIKAIKKEKEWFSVFLKEYPSREIDRRLHKQLSCMLESKLNRKIEILIAQDIFANGMKKTLRWLMGRNKYNLPSKVVSRAISRSLIMKFQQR